MQEEISFGMWLRKQRRGLDLSRKALANQVGCAEVTLRRIETGTLKPSKELAALLLKKLGIPESERLQWIAFARGVSGLPHSSSLSSGKPITNLPAPLTSFIGREKEQVDLINRISKHRLVTLTGSGGVGKTRLSIKVGEQIAGGYPNGVWLVELAPIFDPLLVARTVATTIGLRDETQRPVIDMLLDYLTEKQMLFILDNCEHVLDTCAQLVHTLLTHCPGVKIFCTSREALGILGEAVYRVPSLALPDTGQVVDHLRDYESVRLFEQRAQLIQFDFSITLENIVSIAQICQRLDGIPLAIELAAAKVAVFSPEQIAKQLQDNFNLLAQGGRTALPRHQTLRASINWSWNLLTESEQRLGQQVSVFVRGWTLEAAQSVCDGDVLNLLNSLVAKSLIVMNQQAETSARYSFHETIRQYAHEKLQAAGGGEALRDQHLAYFVKLVEQAEPELYRSNQAFWLNKLDDDLNNLLSALGWALATDVASGLRLMVSARLFWDARGNNQEVGDWLARLLELYNENDSLHAKALVVYSKVLTLQGVRAEAQKAANQSLELSRAISDKQTEAFSLWGLGASFQFYNDVRQGAPLLEQSLALYESLGDKLGQATALEWLCVDHSDPERAKTYIEESLKLYRELGHLAGIAESLADLANIKINKEGDFSSAILLLEEALTINRQIGSRWGEVFTLLSYGSLALNQGDYQQARAYYEQAIPLQEKVAGAFTSSLRANMAYALLRLGDSVKARESFEISIQEYQRNDDLSGIVFAIEGLASLYVSQEQPERAARLFAWTGAMLKKTGDHRSPAEQKFVEKDFAVIHSRLDDAEFSKLSEEGHVLTIEQAIALALDTREEK